VISCGSGPPGPWDIPDSMPRKSPPSGLTDSDRRFCSVGPIFFLAPEGKTPPCPRGLNSRHAEGEKSVALWTRRAANGVCAKRRAAGGANELLR
jgi:hypothetical protein